MNEALVVLMWLMLKHTIADYLLQKPWKDKGIYGSNGGLIHATHHGIGALLVLTFFVAPYLAILMAFLDGLLHYHIDYAKNKIKKTFKLDNTQTLYWGLHGLDQYLHVLTYILIIWILYGN
jgi:hypothetical protein